MMIVKTLTETDLSYYAKLYLPKKNVEDFLKIIGSPNVPKNGIQLEIQDYDKSYWVTLKHSTPHYYIGAGWTELKTAKYLKVGDTIGLCWEDNKFSLSVLDSNVNSLSSQENQEGQSSSSMAQPKKKESSSSTAQPKNKERSSSTAQPKKKESSSSTAQPKKRESSSSTAQPKKKEKKK